jgi:hypothetical protein
MNRWHYLEELSIWAISEHPEQFTVVAWTYIPYPFAELKNALLGNHLVSLDPELDHRARKCSNIELSPPCGEACRIY